MEKPFISGSCVFERYDRSPQGSIVRATFEARDLYDVMYKVVENVGLYICIDQLTEEPQPDWDEDDLDYNYYVADDATQEERDAMARKILSRIEESNGDGCDFIMSLKWNGEELISNEEDIYETEEW